MPFAITQSCVVDASCVSVCPVGCIHPAPGEVDFGTTDILYVDPQSCIDCGACADACPTNAVKPIELLRGGEQAFAALNADFYTDRPASEAPQDPTHSRVLDKVQDGLRVAVVGTGPAASYAARELLAATDATVTMIDRLPVPGGLLRGGVAPDHHDTKGVIDTFEWTYSHPRAELFMNVEVGRDITHAELLKHHDAVIYGVGAPDDRRLGIPGEDLDGVLGSIPMVGWYNGDSDVTADAVVLPAEGRAFVVGNGNVALDVARILLGDPDRLATTDIADHALDQLRTSDVREVVLLGRRGPEHAAFTRPELLVLPDDIELCVESDPTTDATIDAAVPGSTAAALQGARRVTTDWSQAPEPGRRLVMAFGAQVAEASGSGRLEQVTITRPDGVVEAPTELLVLSTGRRGRPVPDLPFDADRGVVPNVDGRVIDPVTDEAVPGAYVVGWIKRGAWGGIGTNRTDSHETVRALAHDSAEGTLPTPTRSARQFSRLVSRRQPDVVRMRGVRAIQRREREAGQASGRPRVKLVTVEDLLRASRR